MTSISESFYKKYLSNKEIGPIVTEFCSRGGPGGQHVPFLGYVAVVVHFPKNEIGTVERFETLALVVPDNKYNSRVPLIIGTNLAIRCKKSCETTESPAWTRAFNALKYHGKLFKEENANQLKVKSTSRRPIKIGSHEMVCVWGLARSIPGIPTKVNLESKECQDQSHGLVVTPSLVTLSPKGTKCPVPVEISQITNNISHPVILSPGETIATAYLAQGVVARDQGKSERTGPVDEQSEGVGVDLSDTPLTMEQLITTS